MRARHLLLFGVAASLLFGLTLEAVQAAPAARSCIGAQVYITSPAPDSTISSTVSIIGSAILPGNEMRYYDLEYAAAGSNAWIPIVSRVRTPVQDGVLANISVSQLPVGDYSFRLRAVDPTGNYCEAYASPVHVSADPNAGQTVTPTDIATTPTSPALLPTIEPGTPKVVVDLPANGPQQNPALSLSAKPGGPALPSLPFDVAGLGVTFGDWAGQLGQQFVFGAQLTAGLFVLLGVVVFLRNNL